MSVFQLPQCVIAWERGKRPQVYGPFANTLAAADFCNEHQQETGITCEVRPIYSAPTYGEEGL